MTTCFAARYSPFGVFTIDSFETGIPCFSAKLIAARVGSPTLIERDRFRRPGDFARHIFLTQSHAARDRNQPPRRAESFN